MIAHVVLFKPQPSMGAERQLAVLHALNAAVTESPSIRACRVGRRVRHGLPGYEQAMAEDYQYFLILEFDDVEGLRRYLTHATHEQLGDFFSSGAEASLAYDYEMLDLKT
jgi:hypothetical protein